MKTPSDRRLLLAARRGSPAATEALIERHWARAHRIAYGLLGDAHAAEDVTQEAMLAVVAGISRLDSLRPFEPWLHRVVTNGALDWARSRARRPEIPVAAHDTGLEYETEPTLIGDPALGAALAELSPEHRSVVILRHVGGYGPREIGRILGIPRGTVGSRLRRALDELRIEMEASDG